MAPIPTRNRRIIPLDQRKRVSAACDRCRSRKIKCEGGFPCSKCIISKKECIITPRDIPLNPLDYKQQYNNVKAYNCKLERIIQFLFPDVSLEYLRNNIDEFEKQVCINKSRLPHVSTPITPENSTGGNKLLSPNSAKSDTAVKLETLKNFNQVFVSTTDQSFIDFIQKSSHEIVQPELSKTTFSYNNKEFVRANLLTLVKDAVAILPEDDKIRKLVRIYLNICETNYFYVHHTNFYKKVEEFIVKRREQDLEFFIRDWPNLVILLAMMAISAGFEYMDDNQPIPNFVLDTSPGLIYYYAALPFAGFLIDQKSIESVQGLLIFGVFMTTNKLENFQMFDGGYLFMNLALEIAIANKLYLKEPYRNYSIEDQEVYKRLWWSCYTMERRFGINLGKSEIISPDDITVELPSNVPALNNSLGYSNYLSQSSMIDLNYIFRDIAELYQPRTKSKDNEARISIDPKMVRKLVEDAEECKINFPEYAQVDRLDPTSQLYRGSIHLNLAYYLAKIYIGKPFLLYKVDNFRRLAEQSDYESAFVDHLSSICIDAAFCTIELLSELDKHNKLGLFSCTDINFCNISLFTILVFLKIDRSETTLLFLRKGLKILKTMSNGCSSAKSSLQKLKKLDNLVSDFAELDEMQKDMNTLFSVETAAKSFPTHEDNNDPILQFEGVKDVDISQLFEGIDDFLGQVDNDIYQQLQLQ